MANFSFFIFLQGGCLFLLFLMFQGFMAYLFCFFLAASEGLSFFGHFFLDRFYSSYQFLSAASTPGVHIYSTSRSRSSPSFPPIWLHRYGNVTFRPKPKPGPVTAPITAATPAKPEYHDSKLALHPPSPLTPSSPLTPPLPPTMPRRPSRPAGSDRPGSTRSSVEMYAIIWQSSVIWALNFLWAVSVSICPFLLTLLVAPTWGMASYPLWRGSL